MKFLKLLEPMIFLIHEIQDILEINLIFEINETN